MLHFNHLGQSGLEILGALNVTLGRKTVSKIIDALAKAYYDRVLCVLFFDKVKRCYIVFFVVDNYVVVRTRALKAAGG